MSADVLENGIALFSIAEPDVNIIRFRPCFSLCLKTVRGGR